MSISLGVCQRGGSRSSIGGRELAFHTARGFASECFWDFVICLRTGDDAALAATAIRKTYRHLNRAGAALSGAPIRNYRVKMMIGDR